MKNVFLTTDNILEKFFHIIICSLFLFVVSPLTAQSKFSGFSGNGIRVLVDESIVKNGQKSDEWIAEKLKSDFINDLLNYSELEVINSSDKDKIFELQRDSESDTYGETVIEIGKRIQADKYITIVTNKNGNVYTSSVSLINITTGKVEYGYSMNKSYEQKEFDEKAHGELALVILENGFGIQLTEKARSELLKDKSFGFKEKQKRRTSIGVTGIYSGNSDITIVSAGITATCGITKNFFIGAAGAAGVPYSSAGILPSSSFNYNSSLRTNPYSEINFTGMGLIGGNVNLTKNLRFSLYGQGGYICSGFGGGLGLSAEYFIKHFGLYASYGLLWTTNLGFLDNYSLTLEIPIGK